MSFLSALTLDKISLKLDFGLRYRDPTITFLGEQFSSTKSDSNSGDIIKITSNVSGMLVMNIYCKTAESSHIKKKQKRLYI